ncbi:MAG TPA: RluA family pseudouridine synthase [Firmicutes bacterium]|nr:RluA family pseudouridine synthase [Bacillota bacterium]
MKSFTIGENDAGQRLDKFITKAMPRLPKSLMYKYIRLKRIKVDGKRAEISTRLQKGSVVDAYVADEFLEPVEPKYDFLSAPARLDIVYEDENILLADKKQGLIVHPDDREYRDTLITRIQRYLYEKGEYNPADENSFRPALANRIDRNTGGIVLAAKNAEALRILCDKIKDREIEKRYLAVAHGIFPEKQALLEGYLTKNEAKNQVYLSRSATENSRTVRTAYTVLRERRRPDLSLLEVDLLTGRTHQIRAHLASIGHPLLGDGKYGVNQADRKMGYKHQALYSYKLTFRFSSDAGLLQYLDGKTFQVPRVWFAEELFGYRLGKSDGQPGL